MSDDRVWLRHKDHDGAFHCPAEAVEAWADMGWAPGDPPEEHNPVVAENLAAQKAEADRLAAEAKATKTSRKGGADDTTTKEG
jgi:hypothetical protein